ncbi:MAG: alginate export family protein [Granulosicoccus sp.]
MNRILTKLNLISLFLLVSIPGFADDTSSWDALKYGGEVELEYSQDANVNLQSTDNEDEIKLVGSAKFMLTYEPNDRYLTHLELKYGRELEIENVEYDRSYETFLELDELYFKASDLMDSERIKNVDITLGRFSIDDSRAWLYDQSVDGFNITFEHRDLGTEYGLSLNREEWFGSDLLNHDDKDPVSNVIVFARHKPFDDINLDLSVHAISRRDSSDDNDSPDIFGMSAEGKLLDKHLEYWAIVAWARGEDDDEKISGQGLDIGISYDLNWTLKPYLTFAYALGQGSGDEDTDFRQSGLQRNTTKFGGVAKFKYYGEVLDPELSNLHILTAGIGFRPIPRASIDLIYHRYHQDHPLDELRNTDFDTDPNGVDEDIGDALDIIIGLENGRNMEAEFTLGYFRPGEAFDDVENSAFIAKASIAYFF